MTPAWTQPNIDPRPQPGPNSHHVRKIIRVGRSAAVIIPPHVLDHLGVAQGDYLIWDISARHFGIISRAAAPPYVTDPDRFSPTKDVASSADTAEQRPPAKVEPDQ